MKIKTCENLPSTSGLKKDSSLNQLLPPPPPPPPPSYHIESKISSYLKPLNISDR